MLPADSTVRSAHGAGACLCLALAVAFSVAGCDGLAPDPLPPENLVLVTFDTLRADHVGTYGYDRPTTPNIDRFAERSVVFETAYSQAASTVPALTSLMTSRYPHQTGVLETYKYAVPEDEVTLAERMLDHGFHTGAVLGIGVLMPSRRLDQGFKDYSFTRYTNKQYWKTAPEITDEALVWLEENRAKPFFLWVHYFEPHQPYDVVPEEAQRRFLGEPSSHALLDGVEAGSQRYAYLKTKIDAYDGALAYVDSEFGRLLDRMEALGLFDDSMIVVSADHGETLGEHGQHGHVFGLWEPVVRIPFIVYAPGVQPSRVPGRAEQVDFVPTVIDAFDLARPAAEDGSRAGGLEGVVLPLPRSDDWRFWRSPRVPEKNAYAETWFKNHRVASMVGARYKVIVDQPLDGSDAQVHLFDLIADPHELADLSASRRDEASRLEEDLRAWMAGDFRTPDVIGKRSGELEMLQALGYVE